MPGFPTLRGAGDRYRGTVELYWNHGQTSIGDLAAQYASWR